MCCSLYKYRRPTKPSASIVTWRHQGQDYKRQSDAGLSIWEKKDHFAVIYLFQASNPPNSQHKWTLKSRMLDFAAKSVYKKS